MTLKSPEMKCPEPDYKTFEHKMFNPQVVLNSINENTLPANFLGHPVFKKQKFYAGVPEFLYKSRWKQLKSLEPIRLSFI